MAAKTMYQIVGRYMNGSEVTGYHLHSMETGKAGRFSREQVAFLVGKGQVTNCTGQIYQDKLILRGTNGSLDDLPVQQEDGRFKGSETIGHVRKNTSAADAMTQFMIVGVLRDKKNVVGYIVQNAGGATKKLRKSDVIKLAKKGGIGNARVQMNNGQELLRGYNCNLADLPSEQFQADAQVG